MEEFYKVNLLIFVRYKLMIKRVLVLLAGVLILLSINSCASSKNNNQNTQREIILTDASDGESGKNELSLNDKYMEVASNEPDLYESDILASINKWYFDLYPNSSERANAFFLASLMDPCTFEWAKDVKEEMDKEKTIEDKIDALQNWMYANLTHTQSGYFSGPGYDPWGVRDLYPDPTYKAETPSEMKALSVYTGKNTGKCNSLALTNADIMLLLGANPDDIVQIVLDINGMNHVICFAKFEGKVLYFNNTSVALLGKDGLMEKQQALGFLTYSTNRSKGFELAGKIGNDNEPLIDSILGLAELPKDSLGNKVDILYKFQNRRDLVSEIFMNKDNSGLYALTKYAYQSLYVKRPELYLTASMRTSGPLDLADELNSPEEIFNWIKTNIVTGSIFEDSEDRIMTADEVIACKQGSLKDQAVLAFTLLKHKGFDPAVYICKDNAYIEFDKKTYEAKDWNEVQSITGNVLLKLKI